MAHSAARRGRFRQTSSVDARLFMSPSANLERGRLWVFRLGTAPTHWQASEGRYQGPHISIYFFIRLLRRGVSIYDVWGSVGFLSKLNSEAPVLVVSSSRSSSSGLPNMKMKAHHHTSETCRLQHGHHVDAKVRRQYRFPPAGCQRAFATCVAEWLYEGSKVGC